MSELLGLELELSLINLQDGSIENRADEAIAAFNTAKQHTPAKSDIVPEVCYHVVEFNSSPSPLVDLLAETRQSLNLLDTVLEPVGIAAVPFSRIDSDKASIRDGSPRYNAVAAVLGEERMTQYASMCGTHVHIDKRPGLEVAQMNVLQSVHPAFAFASQSSYFLGQNTHNSGRVYAWTNEVFKNTPLHTDMPGYFTEMDEVRSWNSMLVSRWLELAQMAYGRDISGDVRDVFQLDNTYWGPVRMRAKTLELRSSDTQFPSFAAAEAALLKGIDSFVFDAGYHVRAAQAGEQYGRLGSEFVLPSFAQVHALSNEATEHGVGSESVHRYLSHLMDVAYEGLPEAERHLLRPYQAVLAEKRNLADVIGGFIHSTGQPVDRHILRQAGLFMHGLYRMDLNELDVTPVLREYTKKAA